MQTLIRKINSWFEQPEIKEAERFEDWFQREIAPMRISTTLEISQKIARDFPLDKSITPVDYSKIPDDVPSQEDWYKFRIWYDEVNGLSYTG